MEWINKMVFGAVDPNAPVAPPPEPLHKIPHELATWITFKCFDACIGDFNDKNLIGQERYCIKECTEHLKTQSESYQATQEFRGFVETQKPILPTTMGTQLPQFNINAVGTPKK